MMKGMAPWIFEGKEFDERDIGKAYGFVYDETFPDVEPGGIKKYGGLRTFSENWMNYHGSGADVDPHIKKVGVDRILAETKREILSIHYTPDDLDAAEREFLTSVDAPKNDLYLNIRYGGNHTLPLERYKTTVFYNNERHDFYTTAMVVNWIYSEFGIKIYGQTIDKCCNGESVKYEHIGLQNIFRTMNESPEHLAELEAKRDLLREHYITVEKDGKKHTFFSLSQTSREIGEALGNADINLTAAMVGECVDGDWLIYEKYGIDNMYRTLKGSPEDLAELERKRQVTRENQKGEAVVIVKDGIDYEFEILEEAGRKIGEIIGKPWFSVFGSTIAGYADCKSIAWEELGIDDIYRKKCNSEEDKIERADKREKLRSNKKHDKAGTINFITIIRNGKFEFVNAGKAANWLNEILKNENTEHGNIKGKHILLMADGESLDYRKYGIENIYRGLKDSDSELAELEKKRNELSLLLEKRHTNAVPITLVIRKTEYEFVTAKEAGKEAGNLLGGEFENVEFDSRNIMRWADGGPGWEKYGFDDIYRTDGVRNTKPEFRPTRKSRMGTPVPVTFVIRKTVHNFETATNASKNIGSLLGGEYEKKIFTCDIILRWADGRGIGWEGYNGIDDVYITDMTDAEREKLEQRRKYLRNRKNSKHGKKYILWNGNKRLNDEALIGQKAVAEFLNVPVTEVGQWTIRINPSKTFRGLGITKIECGDRIIT